MTGHYKFASPERSSDAETNASPDAVGHPRVEYHLFILWEKARHQEQKILSALHDRFTIKAILEVEWSEANTVANFVRFYGQQPSKTSSAKVRDVGGGPFLAIVVRDDKPRYRYRTPVSGGYKLLNANAIDSKQLFRAWAGGGYRVHGSADPFEFERDMTLLFGPDFARDLDLANSSTWNGKIKKLRADLSGAISWHDLKEFLASLNKCTDYVVLWDYENLNLANTESVPAKLNLLCRSRSSFASAANALAYSRVKSNNFSVRVAGKQIDIDLMSVGDGSFDANWQQHILKRRVLTNDLLFAPSKSDHFFTLLYYCAVHRPVFPEKYVSVLSDLSTQIGVDDLLRNWAPRKKEGFHRNVSKLKFILSSFLQGQGYEITLPRDLNIPLNYRFLSRIDRQVRPLAIDLLRHRLQRLIQSQKHRSRQAGRGKAHRPALTSENAPALGSKAIALSPSTKRPAAADRTFSIRGVVASGRGRATDRLTCLEREFTEYFGRPPTPGTLNVVLREPLEFSPNRLAYSFEGYRYFWPTLLNGHACLAYRSPGCALHIIEIVADRNFRAEDNLQNGETVTLQFEGGVSSLPPMRRRLSWNLLWKYRESLYYSSDSYLHFVGRVPLLSRQSAQKTLRG